ncbi:F-box/kelch-repeat protein At3g23880-like [Silene latifolia]|uniref:F-box/kelch-repeat protein At3g23880-like n=1 Tax=Silene latifolia TaxID=37657 RepID=UPI003D784757
MKSTTEKEKSTSSSSSMSNKHSESKYLPPEVWTLIFLSLPAKTLLRFRCVCKSWCSIIDNPRFVNMHFKLCKINNGNDNKLLLAFESLGYLQNEGCLLTTRDAETLEETDHIFRKSESYKYHIRGSCNGLLLVRQRSVYCNHKELRLWNPCIRKSLVIPTCPLCPHPLPLLDPGQYLFGFAPDIQDYKVVRLTSDYSLDKKSEKIYVAVYTLSNQQWTVRNDPINVTYANSYNRIRLFHSLSTAVYFQGAAYWVVQNEKEKSGFLTYLASFDFDKEIITFLELPFSLDETRYSKLFPFLLGESLAVFTISKVSSSIWVLEQDNKKRPWTLWFSGKSSLRGYLSFKVYDGSIKKIFFCERDGGYFVYGKKAYNLASCEPQELNKSMSSFSALETYSESLVLSKTYGARDLMVFP